jgi:hypothetical protein
MAEEKITTTPTELADWLDQLFSEYPAVVDGYPRDMTAELLQTEWDMVRRALRLLARSEEE